MLVLGGLRGQRAPAARPAGDLAAGAVRVPVRLRIPAIGVDAPVVPTGVQAGGALAIPPDPDDVGWRAAGAFPGESTGAVILAGHVDSAASGPGALFRLQDVRPGAGITVTANGHACRYRVAALRAYAKDALPAAASSASGCRPGWSSSPAEARSTRRQATTWRTSSPTRSRWEAPEGEFNPGPLSPTC